MTDVAFSTATGEPRDSSIDETWYILGTELGTFYTGYPPKPWTRQPELAVFGLTFEAARQYADALPFYVSCLFGKIIVLEYDRTNGNVKRATAPEPVGLPAGSIRLGKKMMY